MKVSLFKKFEKFLIMFASYIFMAIFFFILLQLSLITKL